MFDIIEKLEETRGLLDAKAVQEITGWSRSKTHRMMKNGTVPTVNFGAKTKTDRVVNPKTWAHFLLKTDPALRASHRGSR